MLCSFKPYISLDTSYFGNRQTFCRTFTSRVLLFSFSFLFISSCHSHEKTSFHLWLFPNSQLFAAFLSYYEVICELP